MNKLMGFLELKEMSLPSIPWKQGMRNWMRNIFGL